MLRFGMFRFGLLIAAIVLLSISPVSAALGQPGRIRGSGETGNPTRLSQRIYDLNTVETFSGEVLGVDRISSRSNGGIHLRVATDQGIIPVHLGPTWYIEEQDISIEQGDRIIVTGSRVTIADEPTVIAAEVRRGDQLLNLRDQDGTPLWRGNHRTRGGHRAP